MEVVRLFLAALCICVIGLSVLDFIYCYRFPIVFLLACVIVAVSLLVLVALSLEAWRRMLSEVTMKKISGSF